MGKSKMIAVLFMIVTAFALSFGLAGRAEAHAKLVSAEPAANQMAMPAPSELHLKFSEGVEIDFTKVELIGPDGKPRKIGPVKVGSPDQSTIIVPILEPLADGKYTV